MSLTFTRRAAGLALLAVIAAGCGSAAATRPSGVQPKPTHSASTSHGASPATHQGQAHRTAPPSTIPATPPTMAPAPPPPTMAPAPPPPTMAPANTIPQGDGGDHDADNNGGPSDGDGNV